jgi:hypothetical protein
MTDRQEDKEMPLKQVIKNHGLVWGSVALNLFLVGVVVSPLVTGMRQPLLPPFPRPGHFPIERLEERLSPDEAARLQAIYQEASAKIQARHDEIGHISSQIASILRAEKPDLDALQKASEMLRSVGQDFHASMAEVMRRVAVEFPLETRRKIADQFEHGDLAFSLHGRPRNEHFPEHRGPFPPEGGMMPPPGMGMTPPDMMNGPGTSRQGDQGEPGAIASPTTP